MRDAFTPDRSSFDTFFSLLHSAVRGVAALTVLLLLLQAALFVGIGAHAATAFDQLTSAFGVRQAFPFLAYWAIVLALASLAVPHFRLCFLSPFGVGSQRARLRSVIIILVACLAPFVGHQCLEAAPKVWRSLRGLDEQGLPEPREVNPLQSHWFSVSGEPLLWCEPEGPSRVRFWNRPGYSPLTGQTLLPVSPELRRRFESSLRENQRREAESARPLPSHSRESQGRSLRQRDKDAERSPRPSTLAKPSFLRASHLPQRKSDALPVHTARLFRGRVLVTRVRGDSVSIWANGPVRVWADGQIHRQVVLLPGRRLRLQASEQIFAAPL